MVLNPKNNQYLVVLAIALFMVSACSVEVRRKAEQLGEHPQSIFTDIRIDLCEKFIDENDPNSIPHQICPGISGYKLMVRHVGAGRQSIDVITPSNEAFPLNLQDFFGRNMYHLGRKVEWRALNKDGMRNPFALIVEVQVHGDMEAPQRVTQSFFALSKITPNEICVTHRVPANDLSHAQLWELADRSVRMDCQKATP